MCAWYGRVLYCLPPGPVLNAPPPISRDGAADPHEAWPTKPARQFENVAVVRKWARHRDPMGGIGPLGQPSRVSANLPKRRNVPTLGDAAAGSSSLTQVAGDPTNKAQRACRQRSSDTAGAGGALDGTPLRPTQHATAPVSWLSGRRRSGLPGRGTVPTSAALAGTSPSSMPVEARSRFRTTGQRLLAGCCEVAANASS